MISISDALKTSLTYGFATVSVEAGSEREDGSMAWLSLDYLTYGSFATAAIEFE